MRTSWFVQSQDVPDIHHCARLWVGDGSTLSRSLTLITCRGL